MYTIIIIFLVGISLWIFYDWAYKNICWSEMKKHCGKIHPLDYIVLQKKKLELKNIEAYTMKEESFIQKHINKLLKKRVEIIGKERDSKK